MRIGMLTTSFPRSTDDPAGAFVLGFARALAAEGHAVEVLAPEPAERGAPPRWPGVRVGWVPYLRPRERARTFYGAGVVDNLARDPWAWVGLGPFVVSLAAHARFAASGWDAVVSHWLLPSALVAGAVRGVRPHLAVAHSGDVHLLEGLPGRRAVARRVAGSASALLFASAQLRERFLRLLPPRDAPGVAARSHVSPMGIDPMPIHRGDRVRARRALGIGGRERVALSLSRLVPIKGVDVAIDASVATRNPVTLLVAGDGPERPLLEARAARRGARVRFLGEVRGDGKRDALAAADLFVAASRRLPNGRTEGSPTAVLEALSAGLPTVATRTGGLPDLLAQGRAGQLVPPDDPEALAAAIDAVLTAPALRRRLRRAARSRAARFSWGAMAPTLASLATSRSA